MKIMNTILFQIDSLASCTVDYEHINPLGLDIDSAYSLGTMAEAYVSKG